MKWFKQEQGNAHIAMRCHNDITHIVKVSRPAHGKPRIELASVESIDITSIPALKKLTREYKLDANPVTYLLETTDHEHFQIEKPNVPEEELKEAVRWALKDLISTQVEDITLDVIELPQEDEAEADQKYMYAICAKNNHIARISNNLLDAKVKLTAIDASIMAQRNIAVHLAKENEGEALITFSDTAAILTFTYHGEIYNARQIEFDPDNISSSFERIALEIQRSLDVFENRFHAVYIKRLLVGPFALREQFCDALSASLYIDVETFELSEIFDFSPEVDIQTLSHQAAFLPTLGAALREEAAR